MSDTSSSTLSDSSIPSDNVSISTTIMAWASLLFTIGSIIACFVLNPLKLPMKVAGT